MVSNPGIIAAPAAPIQDATSNSELAYYLSNAGTFKHVVDLIYNRILEFTLPYFSNTHISLLRGTNVTPSNFDDRTTQAYLFAGAGTTGVDVLKAAGDDFSFGWLVGPPRLAKLPPPGIQLSVVFDSGENFGAFEDSTGAFYFSFDAPLFAGADIPQSGLFFAGTSILWGQEEVLQILTTTETLEIPITQCKFYSGEAGKCSIRVPLSVAPEEVSSVTTVSSLQTLMSVNIIVEPNAATGTYPTPTTGNITPSGSGVSYSTSTGLLTIPVASSLTGNRYIIDYDKVWKVDLVGGAQFDVSLVGAQIDSAIPAVTLAVGMGLDVDAPATAATNLAIGVTSVDTALV